MAKLAPIFNDAQLINGIPANGAKLFTYVAGSATKQTTYTGEDGLTPQSNPIILDSRGEPSQAVWLTEGASYKFVFSAADDTDPPTSPIRTIDNVTGINDATVALSQWVDYGIAPTYISATSFSLSGDQTSQYQVNRRIKATVTAGTVYGYISVSSYTSLTTITVVLDSGGLDSGLTKVELGLITADSTSLPKIPNFVNTSMLSNSIFNDLTTVTFDPATDYVSIADGSDSGNKKKALLPTASDTVQGISELLTAAEYAAGTDPSRVLTAAVARAQNFVRSTAINTTSGTSHDFTGIPSWAKIIFVLLNGVSTNGTSANQLQLGAGSITNTGYTSNGADIVSAGASGGVTSTTGLILERPNNVGAAGSRIYVAVLINITGNTWLCANNGISGSVSILGGGSITLSGTLDRVRLTTVNGTDTFDAGSLNIIYG